uniref:Uncharacterized protein n=1 Tax=Brassica oleracea var. oleracea TaxID=109376 RepID=A0A0D2ZQJ6_BRAOL
MSLLRQVRQRFSTTQEHLQELLSLYKISLVWERVDAAKAEAFGTAVASGLICGDGIWSFPSSVLAIAGVNPSGCMKFLSAATNSKVDSFLKRS